MLFPFARFVPARSLFLSGAAVLLLVGSGLAGGCTPLGNVLKSAFTVESENLRPTDIARGLTASRTTVPCAPDSLGRLRITEEDGHLKITHPQSLEAVWRQWSLGSPASRTLRTLRSLELELYAMKYDQGLETLSADLAREVIRETRARHDSLIFVDAYPVARPHVYYSSINVLDVSPLLQRRIELEDEDGFEQPLKRVEKGILQEVYLGGRQYYYRRITFVFDRFTEDGRDLLGAARLRLGRDVWDLPYEAPRE